MNLITLSKLQDVRQLDDYVKTSARLGRLQIDNTNLRLEFATQCNKKLHTLWFVNESKDTHKVGLSYMHSGTNVLVRLTGVDYVQINYVHELMWICEKTDGRFDIFLGNKKVADNIISWDMLTLGNELKLVQLNDSDNVYLVLTVMSDLYKGIYIPRDLQDFLHWYEDFVHKLGYQGYLDNVNVSELFRVQYEVQQCIFFEQKYKILCNLEDIYE